MERVIISLHGSPFVILMKIENEEHLCAMVRFSTVHYYLPFGVSYWSGQSAMKKESKLIKPG
jgi:hypothetical protein